MNKTTMDDLTFCYYFCTSYVEGCLCADCNRFEEVWTQVRFSSEWDGIDLADPLPIEGRECHMIGCPNLSSHEVDLFDNNHRYYLCLDHVQHACNRHLVVSHRPLDMFVID